MRKTPSPYDVQSSYRKQNSVNSKQNGNAQKIPFWKYFKKVTGIFTIFLFRQRKAVEVVSKDIKVNPRIERISFSNDLSTGSNRSNSRFRFSNSYSSSSNTSGLIGTINFTIEDIYKATENFSPAYQIGAGAFGTVYKGKLYDGTVVAVKRAKKNDYDKRLSSEYQNEVLTLSKIEHLNLVRLYGYVEYRDERIIVVEYVSNGNLREHLDGARGNGLKISERLDIAIDVAHSITYLHMYTDPPIIHRDIKASNILITEKLRAKVADFGFARLTAGDPGTTHISTNIKGTTGYLDPEYLRTYQLTEKSDVYSFGVLLVELVSGRHPIDQKRPMKERVTTRWALQKLKEKEAVLVMDPRLTRSPASNMVVEKVLELASRCLASLRQSRPSMKECAEVLWRIRKELKEKSLPSPPTSIVQKSANFPRDDVKKNCERTFGIQDEENYKFISA